MNGSTSLIARIAASREKAPATPRGDTAPIVWRLAADGTVERVEVKTGLRDEQFVEVESSTLKPGDEVAVALRKAPAKKGTVRIFSQPRFR